MHRCLEQPDIVDLIFKETFYRPPGTRAAKDLLALALTCQAFKEAALDILWHTQNNLGPLIKTLPPAQEDPNDFDFDIIIKNQDLNLSDDSLRTFSSYAGRIRRISHVPDARSTHLNQLTRDLAALVPISRQVKKKIKGPLFPNLQHLEFVGVMPWTSLLCITIFLESKIRSFSMHWGDLDNKEAETLFGLIGLGPPLEVLEFIPSSYIPPPSDPNRKSIFEIREPLTLSLILPRLRELRSLSCGSYALTSDAIRYLAIQRRLYKLQTANTAQDILEAITGGPIEDTIKSPFSGLQHLELYESNFLDLVKLIAHMRPLFLQNIVLHHTTIPTASTLNALLLALNDGQNLNALQQFTMKHAPEERHDFTRLRMDAVIDGFALAPLLAFPNLTIVEIDMPRAFDFRDADIQAMAKAWPQLRRLQFGSKIGWGLPPSVTLVGILDLLTRCPHLEHFVVPFDARNAPPPLSASPPVKKDITYLYVGNGRAPAGDAEKEALAVFLERVFPNLCGVGGEWMFQFTENGRAAQMDWDAVVGLTKMHALLGL